MNKDFTWFFDEFGSYSNISCLSSEMEVIPSLQMRKSRLRKVKHFPQDLSAVRVRFEAINK